MDPSPDDTNGVSPDDEDRDTLIDSVVDKYRIVRLLGRGGMGSVYEGVNTRIQKRVALKFIEPSVAKNPDVAERFHREALAASAIDSRHIVQIFDSGVSEDGSPYIVMEFLPGCDLGKHLSAVGQLELGPALHLGVQILKALQRAHASGIVHRDLKPDNVFLVDREGEEAVVKLLDFGVSKITSREGVPVKTLTQQGTVVGTPYYMSPEQAQADPDVDHRTDIYSVGAILYECLTGRPPHSGRSYEQVIVNICTRAVEDVRERAPEVPESVAKVIARALAKKREERFGSAAELLEALIESAPEDTREKYLAPLMALEEIGLRPASAPSSPERRSGATRRSGKSSRARVTPVTDEESMADEFAETVRAESGERAVAPSTLPSAKTTQMLGAKSTRVGLAVAVAALALALVIGIVGRDDDPGALGADPTAAATDSALPSDSAVAEGADEQATTADPAAALGGAGPTETATESADSAEPASSPPATAHAHQAPSPSSRPKGTGSPTKPQGSSKSSLVPSPRPASTPTLSIWR